MKLKNLFFLKLLNIVLLATYVDASVTVVDTFTFHQDIAQDPLYSINPGNDTNSSDHYGANKPIIIKTPGFRPVGSDKLVGVLNLHNSAARLSTVERLRYGNYDLTTSNTILSINSEWCVLIYFYIDNPRSDGHLVITLDDKYNVDEVGLALFALNGTAPGYSDDQETTVESKESPSVYANRGDLVIGTFRRNNGPENIQALPPFSGLDITAGNLNGTVAYLVADKDGIYQPKYTDMSERWGDPKTAIAVIDKIPEPSSLAFLALQILGLFFMRRR